MENKSYELIASNNMKYVAGINFRNKLNNMYEMKVWICSSMREISLLYVYYDLGGERVAISDDGKYVATAQYKDYGESKLYVYEVDSGKTIFENASLKRIQWVMFGNSGSLMTGTESSGMFVFDIFSGICTSTMKGKRVFYNQFGEDILLLKEKKIKYGKQVYTPSTFAYLYAAGAPMGILLSEVNGHLLYYNNEQLCWKSDVLDLGHFISMYYDEKTNIVFGILLNPRKKGDERMHLVLLAGNSGEIIFISSIETASYVFALDTESVLIVNGKGRIYVFEDNRLKTRAFTI